ncbi:MAG: hypothetical protein GY730_00015 [bacterium]|nr:hypothetical protein [bacterium]
MTYLIDILKEDDKDFPNPKYAYNGTVNWMRALKIGCNNINDKSLSDFYSDIQPGKQFPKIALASLFSSINYLKSIHSFKSEHSSGYLNANLAVIGWYYSVFNAVQAMISAFNSSKIDTHNSASNIFFEVSKRGSVVLPFSYMIENTTKKSIDEQISQYLNGGSLGNPLSSEYFPQNDDSSTKCLLAYLKGTADYLNWETEERLKRSKDFKTQGFDSFRTKKARELRDAELEKKKVSFMHQAVRFRGKANYRDCLYFVENKDDKRLIDFFSDLQFVAHKFLLMVSVYVSKRAGSDIWDKFMNNLNEVYRSVLNEKYLEGM